VVPAGSAYPLGSCISRLSDEWAESGSWSTRLCGTYAVGSMWTVAPLAAAALSGRGQRAELEARAGGENATGTTAAVAPSGAHSDCVTDGLPPTGDH
jgi:hypothetical protein